MKLSAITAARRRLVAIACCAVVTVPTLAQADAEPAKSKSSEIIARGEYLVTISGCHDCHTPLKAGPNGSELDMSRALAGHPEDLVVSSPPPVEAPWRYVVVQTGTAWSGPWGVSFTANLTPDKETGLGKWTLRMFTEALRTGRHLGRGRAILPPMPIAMLKHLNDADMEAIFTYLQSIPAIRNRVPAPLPPAGPAVEKHD